MTRTFNSAGVAPIDVYMANDNTNRGTAWFERYHDVTGGSYANNVCIRTQVNTTVSYPTSLYIRTQVDASGSVASLYGIWINTTEPDSSSTVSNSYDISITHCGDSVPGYEALFRLYNSATSAATALDSVFHLANSGGSPFNVLFDFEGAVLPVSAYSSGTTVGYRVACAVGATTYYLHLYTS